MKKNLFLIAVLSFSISKAQQNNIGVQGVVKTTNDRPLSNATVHLRGAIEKITRSDLKGEFFFKAPAGSYELVISFVGYETTNIPLTLNSNQSSPLSLEVKLKLKNDQLDEVVIKKSVNKTSEVAILRAQKMATEMTQNIGSQEMNRKGVSSIEEGLTKVAGISKVEGRGLFVRGLEDRYNSLLMNNLPMPSNNPFKKIIALSLLPTDIVNLVETYKTFNARLYGDFAGGSFNIITKKENTAITKINFGFGLNTNSSLKSFLFSKDANNLKGFVGFSNQGRNLPSILGTEPASKTLTAQQSLDAFSSGWDVVEITAPLNSGVGILTAQNFKIGQKKNSFSYLFAFNMDNQFQNRKGIDRFFNTAQGNYDNNLFTETYTYSTNTSAFANLEYKTERLGLNFNSFYLKTTENFIQDQLGYTNSQATTRNSFIRLNQLQVANFWNNQVLVNYKLSADQKHQLRVGVAYTFTHYELPDRKAFKGVKINADSAAVSYSGNSMIRQYLNFEGKLHIAGFAEYNFYFGNPILSKAHKLTIGYNAYNNKMASSFRFLVSQNLLGNFVSFPTNTPDAMLRAALMNNDFTYHEGTNATYRAELQEIVRSAYTNLAYKLSQKLDMNLGFRLEHTDRITQFREPGSFSSHFKTMQTNQVSLLPAINFKYKWNGQTNLRLAASKTLTKPVIMEAYPLEFVNPDATIENGNPNVLNSENYNIDLKYETFPSAKEMLAVGIFSKFIKNPIEKLFLQSAGSGGLQITYNNSKTAFLLGAEVEGNFQLERINPALSNFSVGFNATLMYSQTAIDPVKNNAETIATDKAPKRQLQGAAPWLLNADIQYKNRFSKGWISTFTLLGNMAGKRIYAFGTNGLDNYYEMPFPQLDFIWINKIKEKWELKLSIENILNPNYAIRLGENSKIPIYENDLSIKGYKKGILFSFGASYML